MKRFNKYYIAIFTKVNFINIYYNIAVGNRNKNCIYIFLILKMYYAIPNTIKITNFMYDEIPNILIKKNLIFHQISGT